MGPRPFLGGWYWLVPIVALAAVRGFWAPDEPRYAQVAKEAFESGSFVVLHLCGEVYPDKPPLVYWLAGAFGWLTGWSEFGMRVPSILATIGSAYLTARIARRWFSERVAQWSVAFYLGTAMVFEIGGRLQLDPILACACLASIAFMIDDSGGERAVTRRTWMAGLCVGMGALAKGPPAWAPVGFALVTWALLPGTLRFAPRRTLSAWVGFASLAVLPVATWALLAIREEPAIASQLLFGQHVGRITAGDKHPGPIWDHARAMPLLLLPWTLLFIAGTVAAWRSWRTREHAGAVRIAAWFAVVFVFFSLIPPKRDLYLLPIYPAAAMLSAFAFERALCAGRLKAWIGATTAATVILLGAFLAAAPWILSAMTRRPSWLESVEDPVAFARAGALCGCALACGGIVACFAFARSRPKLWADGIGTGVAISLTLAAIFLVPAIDEQKCARKLAQLLAARPERPDVLACVGVRPEGIRFYGGGRAGSRSIEEALEREGSAFLAVCRDQDFSKLDANVRARVTEVGRGRVGSRAVLVLVRAQPASVGDGRIGARHVQRETRAAGR